MTVFVAYVTFDIYKGAEAHTTVAEQVGVADGEQIYRLHGSVRCLHTFERAFDTLAEARRWCAGEFDTYAQETSRRASVLLFDSMQEERQHGIV
jgi:hypothetical protein